MVMLLHHQICRKQRLSFALDLAVEQRCVPMQADSVRRCAFASLLGTPRNVVACVSVAHVCAVRRAAALAGVVVHEHVVDIAARTTFARFANINADHTSFAKLIQKLLFNLATARGVYRESA
jgi:hypothetical protein